MKTRFPFVFYWLLIFCFYGCSIEVAQPVAPTPSSVIGSPAPTSPGGLGPADVNTSKTTIPITWAGLNLTGRLVYASAAVAGDTAVGIQALNLGTGEIEQIFTTRADTWVFYLSVSPDTRQLLMSYIPPSQSRTTANRALYVMPLDGATPPELLFPPPTAEDHYLQAEWSHDGKYIYYVHYVKNESPEGQPLPTYTIFRMTYPDGAPEKIADQAFWPRLSADSTKLVFASVDPVSGTNELFVANADGSNVQKIAFTGSQAPGVIDAPIFSPDGKSILFSAPPPAQAYQPNWLDKLTGVQIAKAHNIPSDWWSVPVSGGEPTRLTQLQTINLFASIAPDQKRLASVSGEGLFVMDPDGSNLTQILFNPAISSTVSWIP